MIEYRLVAADLDGTLRPEGREFSPRVHRAVRAAQAQGVHVVMATGRMFRTAERFARDLGLEEAIICDQGATIWDMASSSPIFEKRMPVDLACAVIQLALAEVTLIACVDEEFYVGATTLDATRFVGTYREHLHTVGELTASLGQGPQKLVFIGEPDRISVVLNELAARFGNDLQVVQSFPRYVELTHKDVSKGRAVEWLSHRWNVPRSQVIAIGDQDNDRSMVEWAGLGVAMGNAIPALKDKAQYITASADEDGVADVIEHFVLGNRVAENGG